MHFRVIIMVHIVSVKFRVVISTDRQCHPVGIKLKVLRYVVHDVNVFVVDFVFAVDPTSVQ